MVSIVQTDMAFTRAPEPMIRAWQASRKVGFSFHFSSSSFCSAAVAAARPDPSSTSIVQPPHPPSGQPVAMGVSSVCEAMTTV